MRAGGASESKIARSLGVNTRNVARLMERATVSVYAADSIACAWGQHPAEWWGSEWGEDLSDEMEFAE